MFNRVARARFVEFLQAFDAGAVGGVEVDPGELVGPSDGDHVDFDTVSIASRSV